LTVVSRRSRESRRLVRDYLNQTNEIDRPISIDVPWPRDRRAGQHSTWVLAAGRHGIDISGRQAKHLSTFAGQRFGYVISLCDPVREVCPEFPGHPQMIHWSIADPSGERRGDAETYPAFRLSSARLFRSPRP
jgi:protein-tyrosine-phosphatase